MKSLRWDPSRDSSVALCRRRKWRVGDILEGKEGDDVATIRLDFIGDERDDLIVATRLDDKLRPVSQHSWSLTCRKWRRIVQAPRIAHRSAAYDTKTSTHNFAAWRMQSGDDGSFDELVVRLGECQSIHLETCSANSMFLDIAGVCFWLFKSGGVWLLNGPEIREGTITTGDLKADVARVKKRIAELRKRQRVFAKSRSENK